jgi:hypothetical protein
MGSKSSSFIALAFILVLLFYTQYVPDKQNPLPNQETIKIANWNMQIFGETKSNDLNLMNSYVSKIKQYDIIFLQEIKDESGNAAITLCNDLPDYNCKISSRAGSTSSKEQYIVVYKKNIIVSNFTDYNLQNYSSEGLQIL